MCAMRNRIGIIDETVIFGLQFRFFLKDHGEKTADRTVEHHDHNILFRPAQRDLKRVIMRLLKNTHGLRGFGLCTDQIQRAHDGHGHRAGQTDRTHQNLFPDHDKRQHRPDRSKQPQVQQLLLHGKHRHHVILEHRVHRPKIGFQGHVIHNHAAGSNKDQQLHDLFRFPAAQEIKDTHPDHECAARIEERADHIPDRVQEQVRTHKLCGRGEHHRGRDQKPSQQGHEGGPEEEHTRMRILFEESRFPERPALFHPVHKPGQLEHQRQNNAEDPDLEGVCFQEGKHQSASPGNAAQNAHRFFGFFAFHNKILHQREEIVQRPVHGETGRRIIQEHQKDQGHDIELNPALKRCAFCIDRTGDEIDDGHEDREYIDGQPEQRHHGIRCPKIGNRTKGTILKNLQIGKELIGRNKERDFQDKRKGSPQCVHGAVMILAVIGLQNHEALITVKRPADVLDPV